MKSTDTRDPGEKPWGERRVRMTPSIVLILEYESFPYFLFSLPVSTFSSEVASSLVYLHAAYPSFYPLASSRSASPSLLCNISVLSHPVTQGP